MQKIGRPTPGRAAAKSKPVPTCEHVTQRRRAAHLRACPGNSLRAKCVGRRGMSLRYRQLLRARAAQLVSGKLARQHPGEPCAAGSSPKRPAKHASREQNLGSGARACGTVEKRRENACPLPCLFTCSQKAQISRAFWAAPAPRVLCLHTSAQHAERVLRGWQASLSRRFVKFVARRCTVAPALRGVFAPRPGPDEGCACWDAPLHWYNRLSTGLRDSWRDKFRLRRSRSRHDLRRRDDVGLFDAAQAKDSSQTNTSTAQQRMQL